MKISYRKIVCMLLLLAGCASSKGYLKGVSPSGEKVYLATPDIVNTEAYKQFLVSSRLETDKQKYLFTRLRMSENLEFFHDGAWYDKIQAYRGGMWLMRNRYQKGQNTRDFIKKSVEYSDSGQIHLVRYPDGTQQLGSAVLYNELDLLEETLAKQKA